MSQFHVTWLEAPYAASHVAIAEAGGRPNKELPASCSGATTNPAFGVLD